MARRSGIVLLTLLVALAGATACDRETRQQAEQITGGDIERGRLALYESGCGSCHEVPGVEGARGLVGPPLTHMASRAFIAGTLQNTATNMMTWIMHPQMIVPGNAMPDMGIDESRARDIAAFLYTLR